VRQPGADVFVDGVEMSADEPIALRVGAHELRVAREGFAEQQLHLEAHAGEQIEKSVELAPIRGVLEVASDPSEGDVLIDGHYRGRTPLTLNGLELGRTYQIKVRHAGYRSATRAVPLLSRTPREKVELVLAEQLPRRDQEREAGARDALPAGGPLSAPREGADGTRTSDESGFLIANTQPPARVVIDGQDTGRSTPIGPREKMALSPGRHVVSFVSGGRSFDYEIVVKSGEDTQLLRRLDGP